MAYDARVNKCKHPGKQRRQAVVNPANIPLIYPKALAQREASGEQPRKTVRAQNPISHQRETVKKRAGQGLCQSTLRLLLLAVSYLYIQIRVVHHSIQEHLGPAGRTGSCQVSSFKRDGPFDSTQYCNLMLGWDKLGKLAR